mmetsp:Transcript_19452/g.61940  ORF Transcript_19452/g.61940 Transcript_19452/m.61940 type:complete len:210 (+) Transcript_19452:534-1163(+)
MQYDVGSTAHCNRGFVGDEALASHQALDCRFRLVGCNNAGCPDKVSSFRLPEHAQACGYQLVECPMECGHTVAKRDLGGHQAEQCPMRPAECPYRHMGCTAWPLHQGDVDAHVVACVHAHLALVVDEVAALRKCLDGMEQRVVGIMAQVGQQATAVAASQKLLDKDTKELKALPGVVKSVGNLQSELKSLRNEMRGEVAKLHKSIKELE